MVAQTDRGSGMDRGDRGSMMIMLYVSYAKTAGDNKPTRTNIHLVTFAHLEQQPSYDKFLLFSNGMK